MNILLFILAAFIIIKVVKHLVRSYLLRFAIFFVLGTGLFGSLGSTGLFFNVLRIANFASIFHHVLH